MRGAWPPGHSPVQPFCRGIEVNTLFGLSKIEKETYWTDSWLGIVGLEAERLSLPGPHETFAVEVGAAERIITSLHSVATDLILAVIIGITNQNWIVQACSKCVNPYFHWGVKAIHREVYVPALPPAGPTDMRLYSFKQPPFVESTCLPPPLLHLLSLKKA